MLIKEMFGKIKGFIKKAPSISKEASPEEAVVQAASQAEKTVSQKSNRKKAIVLVVVVLLVLAGLAWGLTSLRNHQKPATTVPDLTPTPTSDEDEIINPSAYATDSAVLKLEEDLKNLEKALLETDLQETSLNPPVLDMAIDFKN